MDSGLIKLNFHFVFTGKCAKLKHTQLKSHRIHNPLTHFMHANLIKINQGVEAKQKNKEHKSE